MARLRLATFNANLSIEWIRNRFWLNHDWAMIHKWCKISSTETSNIPTCIVHSVLFCFRNCRFVTPQEMHNKHPLFIQAIPYVDFPPKISSVTKISLTDRKFLWLPTSSEWSTGNESAEKTQKGLGPDISGSLMSLRKRGGQGLLIQVWGFSFALVSIRFLRDSWRWRCVHS